MKSNPFSGFREGINEEINARVIEGVKINDHRLVLGNLRVADQHRFHTSNNSLHLMDIIITNADRLKDTPVQHS